MTIFNHIKNAPLIIKPKKHILLLSHMRAYTSLLGHIFGSNSDIEGYYEMHTGYYSWKSRYKVKMMYYQEHQAKKGSRFLFDKVLHNEHWVNPSMLKMDSFSPIIAIRDPETTIRSIVAHYQKINPDHEYNSLSFATTYYKERLSGLADIAHQIPEKYLYFDAEAIKTKTDETLAAMSSFLGLTYGLTPNYKKMEKTGARFSGDNSTELFSGAIQTQEKTRDNTIEGLSISDDVLELYQQVRNTLIHNAQLTVKG
jgi:hypothetical protein